MTVTATHDGPLTSASDEVRAFYERMPYPAPLGSLDEHRELYKDPDRRRVQSHLLWPTEPPRDSVDILVAGCGTSQAARYALREPGARIVAIDISETSLGHTRDLQFKYRLENLELHHLPIERVQELGRTFDHIVCTGVLHHLPDPDLGLHALREVLRPEGAMQLMVYAAHGRAGIYMLQEYCRVLGIGPSDADLRALSAVLEALPEDHPAARLLRQAKDFRHPEALADALFHPIDRAYTVPELHAWLERCRMTFGRWTEQAPYLPQCGLMARTPHAVRLAGLPESAQHTAVELFRGTMVRHSFVTYRDDRAAESQPITFVGDAWREYVPIRVPWSVCVRERVPAGSVAVLINRAHPFTDLVLSLDDIDYRLFSAIDGRRTIGEILRRIGSDGRYSRRVPAFFERLWQYDQIVIDASRAARPALEATYPPPSNATYEPVRESHR